MRSKLVISGLLGLLFGFVPAIYGWSIDGQEVARLVPHNTRNYKNDPITFYLTFNKLLSRDLIGMSESNVKDWLGEPYKFSEKRLAMLKRMNVQIPADEPGCTSIYYRIPREEDKPCFHAIKLKLMNNKVVQWSVVHNSEETKPITANVLINIDRCGTIVFLNGNGFRYPETIEKPVPISNKAPSSAEGPRDMNLFNVEPTVLDERMYK